MQPKPTTSTGIIERPALAGMRTAELEALAAEFGQPAYRGRQLAAWIYQKSATTWEEMSDLPAAFRAKLEQKYCILPLVVSDHKRSSDEVDKLLVHRGDNQVFECVLLPYRDRVSCCLSTQVGCPMACTFCATGLGGFARNLSVGEIVGQYLQLQSMSPRRIDHIVFMGMGEPLLNYDALIAAINIFHEEVGLSLRHMTVSTVGLVPQIDRLAKEKLPIHLALSIHSPVDEVRSRLMPVNQRWPVRVVVDAMRRYQATTGRKVTFEYLLIDGVNDTPEQARALAHLVQGFPCFVNLIPWNWVDTGQGFRRPERKRIDQFRTILEANKVNVTERKERGHDIAAACGQLAGQHAGPFGKAAKS